MKNLPNEFASLYLKAIDIMKKLDNERSEYEKRVIEVLNKYQAKKATLFDFLKKTN
jgi:hypothetical protein